MDVHKLTLQLKRQEGVCYKPYWDSVGNLTIGVGHNLSDGISEDTVDQMLAEDIAMAHDELVAHFPIVTALSDVRQNVLVNMAFNLGVADLAEFRLMWAAIERGDFVEAHNQMLESQWSQEVGIRATELAKQLLTDRYI